MISNNSQRKIRQARIRAKISGTKDRPRLCIFKSNRHLYAQVIDDQKSATLASASDLAVKKASAKDRAELVGEKIAKACGTKKIKKVIFDRGGYKYTGIIKIVADTARKKGLSF